ncbi:MAG: hypothetical protein NT001_03870 [Candidatus Woesearchaeota archaeon]|nr:hypothetical protein [Candidatus Woesearchaeota archaeon]
MTSEAIQNIILMNQYFAQVEEKKIKKLDLPPGTRGLLYGGYLKTTLGLLQGLNGDSEGALVALLEGAGTSIRREKKLGQSRAYLTEEEMKECVRISREEPGILPYFIRYMGQEQLTQEKIPDALCRAREAHKIIGNNTLDKVLADHKPDSDNNNRNRGARK